MSIEGQGHFFAIYFPGFVSFVLYLDKISGERLQDHWSSGYCCTTADILTKHLQQCFLFFIVGNSQVSVYRTIGPTLVTLYV